MRGHHRRLSVLLPALVSAVAASCGGSVANDDTKPSKAPLDSAANAGSSSDSETKGAVDSRPVVPVGTEVNLCAGLDYEMLDGVTTTPSVDYLELRNVLDPAYDDVPPPTLAKRGTPCATATNKQKCATDLNARSHTGWSMPFGAGGPPDRYLVATMGDQVKVITSLAEARSFIPPVATAKNAAFRLVAGDVYFVNCLSGAKIATKTEAGWRIPVESGTACGVGTKHESHIFTVTTSAEEILEQTTLLEEGTGGCSPGRRPAGLAARGQHEAPDALGRFFAEAAHLEAASVIAFEKELEAELRELGAPEELIATARASRDDEVRHAKTTAGLARRFCVRTIDAPRVIQIAPRTAFEIAVENAVEGCVRETFGALVAHWQANAACDDVVSRAMRVIAEDETRHSALAWDVAAWLEPRLAAHERRAVDAARAKAIELLRGELATDPNADLVTVAGMPSCCHAVALLDGLDAQFLRAA